MLSEGYGGVPVGVYVYVYVSVSSGAQMIYNCSAIILERMLPQHFKPTVSTHHPFPYNPGLRTKKIPLLTVDPLQRGSLA